MTVGQVRRPGGPVFVHARAITRYCQGVGVWGLRSVTIRRSRLIQWTAFILGFLALDWVSFVHPFGHLPLTPWNPHTGVALAWLIITGVRAWPVVALAHAVATFNASGQYLSPPTIAAAALGYAAVYAVAAFMLRRSGGCRPWLADAAHFIRFALVSVGASCAVAGLTVGIFLLSGQLAAGEIRPAFLRGWIGDLIGIFLFVPLLLRLDGWGPAVLRPSAEWWLQSMSMLVACWIVFGLELTDEFKFFYLLFPPMLWAAVRGGALPCLWVMALTQVCLMLATVLRDLADDKATALQFLMLALVATGLLVSGQVEARKLAEAALRDRLGELARLGRIHSAAEIATGLAHELKQPMLAVLNYVGAAIRLLDRETPMIADALGIMRKADAQVGRADAILRRMRTYVQKGEPHISSVDVDEIVREAIDLVIPLIRRHSVRIETAIAPGLPPLLADPVQVLQVLVNLFSNAVHAVADHASLRRDVVVSARRVAKDRIELAVADGGPGLSPGILAELYQPFVTDRVDGMGLGLAISRSIAEAHGGSLSHDPPAPGHGATFRVVLPCAEVDDA